MCMAESWQSDLHILFVKLNNNGHVAASERIRESSQSTRHLLVCNVSFMCRSCPDIEPAISRHNSLGWPSSRPLLRNLPLVVSPIVIALSPTFSLL